MDGIKSKKQKTVIAVLSLGILIAAGFGIWWATALASTVKTENAKVAGDLADVSSRVSGRITGIDVQEGQEIKAGQILVTLDDSQYRINVQQAQAALHVAQANYNKLPDDVKAAGAAVKKSQAGLDANQASLRSAQVALDDARRQWETSKALFASGGISQEAMNTAESNYSKAQANVEVAAANVEAGKASVQASQIVMDSLNNSAAGVYRAQIEQAQALFDNAKLTQENSRIIADIDGTILRVPVSVGENVMAGQTLLTMSNLNNTWINVNIEEKKIDRIKVNQTAEVSLDAYPGKIFQGKVFEVGDVSQSTFALFSTESSSGSFTKVAQRIPVKIRIDSGGTLLKPGMSAVVKIHTK